MVAPADRGKEREDEGWLGIEGLKAGRKAGRQAGSQAGRQAEKSKKILS
jgi:hypothetical protein